MGHGRRGGADARERAGGRGHMCVTQQGGAGAKGAASLRLSPVSGRVPVSRRCRVRGGSRCSGKGADTRGSASRGKGLMWGREVAGRRRGRSSGRGGPHLEGGAYVSWEEPVLGALHLAEVPCGRRGRTPDTPPTLGAAGPCRPSQSPPLLRVGAVPQPAWVPRVSSEALHPLPRRQPDRTSPVRHWCGPIHDLPTGRAPFARLPLRGCGVL